MCRSLECRSALVVLLVISSGAMAQSSVTGAIGGTVTDPNKAVVPSAVVVVRNIETNKEANAITDGEGRYRVSALEPGNYSVTITLRHFNPFAANNIVVEVGRVTTIDAELSLSPADFGSVVITTTPIINITQQDFTTNINQTAINELPTNGRRWSNFALAAPASAPEGPFGMISFHGISDLLNNNTVDGGDNNQAFLSEERGRTRIGYVIALDSIREFQINTLNYSAEYGRAAGGVVNAVTKSGTNDFHGSVFYFDRDNKWGARNPRSFLNVLINGSPGVLPLKPIDKRRQFGGTLGGPVLRNNLFFFFSYDQQIRNFPAIATPADPAFFTTVNRSTTGAGLKAPNRQLTDAQIDATVAFLNSLTGEVPRRGDETLYLPKIDWNINHRNTLTGSYNRMRWRSPAGVQTNPTVNFGRQSFGNDFVNVDALNLRLGSTINSQLTNEARFQYGRDHESQFSQTPAPGEPLTGPHSRPPQISITGGITFGKPLGLEKGAFPDEKRWQYADIVTVACGAHTLKFGVDFNHVNDLVDNLVSEEGSYAYSTINDFIMDYVNLATSGALRAASRVCTGSTRLAGQCYNGNYIQAFGPSAFKFTTNDYNLFIQDEWRYTSRFTMNLGLRYEYEKLPGTQISNELPNLASLPFGPEQTKTLPADRNNFGPRLGFAWDITGNGKNALRGGYGIYYGRIINSTIFNAIANTGTIQGQQTFAINPATTPATAPVFAATFATATGTTAPPNIVVFDPNMEAPLIHEGDLVFERLVARNTVVSAAYVFSLGRDLPTFIDVNLPAPTSRTYTIVGGDFNGQTVTSPFFAGARPDTRFGALTVIRSLVRSEYHALVLQANRRLTKGLQFDSSYTLSKATDNGQTSVTFSVANLPFNPLDLSSDQGPPNFDVRHKFTADVIWSPKFFAAKRRLLHAIFNGFTFAPIIVAISGAPYSAGTSGNPAGGVSSGINAAGSTLNRVPLFARNSFRLPKIVDVDLRVSRRFNFGEKMRLVVLAEAFNLFNRTQVTAVNTRLYVIGGTAAASTLTFDPSFQTVSAAASAFARERQIQFGVRFEF